MRRQNRGQIANTPSGPDEQTRTQSTGEEAAPSEQSSLARDYRRHKREVLKIPSRLWIQDKELSGYTRDISPGGFRLISDTDLGPGTPLDLKFSFADICFLNISGQVTFCLPVDDGKFGNKAIGIKFAAIRDWEQIILLSSIKELTQTVSSREKSLLTIVVSKDALAQEPVNLGRPTHSPTTAKAIKRSKKPLKFSPDPDWILDLKRYIEPYSNAVLQSRLIQEASAGTLSLKQMRAWIIQLYPFIETFPKWIALNISKTRDSFSRGVMIDNVRVEKRHAEQWVYIAQGFGIDPEELYTVEPLPQVDALTHWLWSINTQGTLAEAVGATNYAIEGVTQGIARLTIRGFPLYDRLDGVHLDEKAYWWMEAHALYDDVHPIQALEIMKLYATTKDLEGKVKFATRRSLEYLLMALETCYTRFRPEGVEKEVLAVPKMDKGFVA